MNLSYITLVRFGAPKMGIHYTWAPNLKEAPKTPPGNLPFFPLSICFASFIYFLTYCFPSQFLFFFLLLLFHLFIISALLPSFFWSFLLSVSLNLKYHSGKGNQVNGYGSHNYHHAIWSYFLIWTSKLMSSSITVKVTNLFINILSLKSEAAPLPSRSLIGQEQNPELHCSYPH